MRASFGFCLLLFFVSVFLQLSVFGDGLVSSPVNPAFPRSTDSLEYVRLAEAFLGGHSFHLLFGDGYRLPGYPAFLTLILLFFPTPWLSARFIQVALCALVPVLAYLTLRGHRDRRLTSLLVAAWVPFHYFSMLLVAESCSLFLMAVLFWLLLKGGAQSQACRCVTIGVTLAALTYLKPNYSLLIFPLLAVILLSSRSSAERLIRPILLTVAFIVCMLPWSVFVSRSAGGFVPLSNTQGYNLYLGLSPKLQAGTILNLQPLPGGAPRSVAAWSKDLQQRALSSWKQFPYENLLYGMSKVVHAFGFSLRSARDALLALFSVISIVSAVLMYRSSARPELLALFLGVTAITAMQAFLFLPNQRLKTALFDYPALLVCGHALSSLLYARRSRGATLDATPRCRDR